MRVLAIGDIHGCSHLLDDLLAWVRPEGDDKVITLGDAVDRGPDTRGVLDRLIVRKREGMNLIVLRGNHELMMLAARNGGREDRKMWLSVGGGQTLSSYGKSPGRSGTLDDIPKDHWDFIENEMLDYYENETNIFVHATVHINLDLPAQTESMLFWDFLPDTMNHFSGKLVICGHTSQKSGAVKVVPGAICIDTFAHGGGWLTCLEAATGHFWQVNVLGHRREGEAGIEVKS